MSLSLKVSPQDGSHNAPIETLTGENMEHLEAFSDGIEPYRHIINEYFGYWYRANHNAGQNIYDEFRAYSYKFPHIKNDTVKCFVWIQHYVDKTVWMDAVGEILSKIAVDYTFNEEDWDDICDETEKAVRWEFAKRVIELGE